MDEQVVYCVSGEYEDGNDFWATFPNRLEADAHYNSLVNTPNMKVLRMTRYVVQIKEKFKYTHP